MTAKRVKRPKLERDRPRREWSTLFGAGPAAAGKEPGAAPPVDGRKSNTEKSVLSDTVELGYRVIEDYLKQGQQAAQAFGAPGWMGGARGPTPPGSADEMQQMAQRVMQYGWDFAGLWFEMWTRMGGQGAPNGWPMPTNPAGAAPTPPSGARAPTAGSTNGAYAGPATTLAVSVDSVLPTTTSVDLEPGSYGKLIVHALRPIDGEGAAIKNVTIERDDESAGFQVNVTVPPNQRPGTYRAPIIEEATNLPKGSLSVRVQSKKR